MRNLLLLTGMLYMITSCNKSERDCYPESFHYSFFANKKLDTATSGNQFSYQVVSGTNLVFEYKYLSEDCKSVSDEEYTEYLVFEIPAGVTGFQYANDDLKNIHCYYRRECFCAFVSGIQVIQGTLEGEKISDTEWRIIANLTITPANNKTILFDKRFKLQ